MSRALDSIRTIWHAGVDAVRPGPRIAHWFAEHPEVRDAVRRAERIVVVGGGKAGAGMAAALEVECADDLGRMTGLISVPADCVRPLAAIRLVAGRPAGSNLPTEAGVRAAAEMLALTYRPRGDTLFFGLLSGGGSALLPAPVAGVSLLDKMTVSWRMSAAGVPIGGMNAVRKHISRIKGGRLVEHLRGRPFYTLVISDVVGDPLDVIASGPTVPDPTTFDDAIAVLREAHLWDTAPPSIREYLRRGHLGEVEETPKHPQENVRNRILASSRMALDAAAIRAASLGYRVHDLGPDIVGDTEAAARTHADIVRAIRKVRSPDSPPICILSGGETTVELPDRPGTGGRNTHFVLALLNELTRSGSVPLSGVTILSGGTDGEDGPTDAAGAFADRDTLHRARRLGLSADESLARCDSGSYFEACDGLFRTGPTNTNVMDLRIVLIDSVEAR